MRLMRRPTARFWVAAAGALLLHGLLLAVVAVVMVLTGLRPVRPVRSLRVDLVRMPKRVDAPPSSQPAPTQNGVLRATPGKSPVPRQNSAPPAPGSGRDVPARNATTGAAAPAHAAHSREWLAREGVSQLRLQLDPAAGGAPPGGGDARPGAGTFGPSEEAPGQGLVREKSREERLAEEKATVSRKVEGWLSDTRARDRAQTGRDVYWQSVEDALRSGFDPGWDSLLQGPGDASRSKMGAVMDAWQKSASAYGKSGNPFGNDPDAPGARRPLHDELTVLGNQDRGLDSVSLGSGLTPLALSPSESVAGKLWSHRLIALVRITQREDGSLFGVELSGTSGSPSYDRLALGQARKLSSLRLGPPQQGRETLWAFETDFTQVPPLPIAGCALDDFIPKDCFYPLQKRVRSRVRLQAIY